MSYTPPQYVDTKAQAILALASVIADEDKTALGDGSVNKALDVLADVLAETDVQVPQTNAGAILALAQYAGGMVKPEGAITITENGEDIDVAQYATADVSVSGGGGVTLGNVNYVFGDDSSVVAGDEIGGGPAILSIAIGDSVVAEWSEEYDILVSKAAGGTDVVAKVTNYDDGLTYSVVAKTFTPNFTDYTYATISEPIDLAVTVTHDESHVYAEFTMPNLSEGVGLLLCATIE